MSSSTHTTRLHFLRSTFNFIHSAAPPADPRAKHGALADTRRALRPPAIPGPPAQWSADRAARARIANLPATGSSPALHRGQAPHPPRPTLALRAGPIARPVA